MAEDLWQAPGMARRRQTGSRRYPRTARLNELVREIVAEEIERIDDERLGFFTVTAVEVEPGLEHASWCLHEEVVEDVDDEGAEAG